ncbi:PilZ domain-containing protein [Geopsychrobacter electrodiphilus]|uniref:PilZ domain-containing protein n=1 Tax=Geopsychrobacter electrodiphilus TaxID=225196 RepID=UPI00035FD2F0|nr:PilZ domain-containing protein [Geopsychrobacter electrodiphilus]
MSHDTSKVRKYPRHKVVQRALVLINQGLDSLPFHIVDVSKGGLAYRYLGPRLKQSKAYKVNLYHETELIVEGLPVKPISDQSLTKSTVPLRRGSFRFETLDSEQNALIERFINTCSEQALPTT